jgi:membrane-associated phospholipid phosphatase
VPGRPCSSPPAPAGGWRPVPGAARLRRYLLLGLALDLLFVVVYGGLNLVTASRAQRWHLYLDWELGIPFRPGWILGYGSLLVLLLLPPFALSPAAMTQLARRFLYATLIAGLAFLLFPAELGFERVEVSGFFGPVYALLHGLDRPHNLVPSLHVAYSTLTVAALGSVSGPWARGLFALWLGVICLSTLLVHQHHLLDVALGLALGAWLHLRDCPWGGEAR